MRMTITLIPFCLFKFQPFKLFEVDLLELKVEGLRIWGLSRWNKSILPARRQEIGGGGGKPGLGSELCPLQVNKSQPPAPQNVTVIGARVFKEV